MDERLYSVDDRSISCKNLVNYGPAVPDITRWQILPFEMIGKHWHIHQNISKFAQSIFIKFSALVDGGDH